VAAHGIPSPPLIFAKLWQLMAALGSPSPPPLSAIL
jgi:hypothetical protein